MSRTPARLEAPSGLPAWMRWGGAGLTGLLAVLFIVVLQQVRDQGQRLQTLQERVQTLENARDLDRTNALEEQLRATVQRLQALEGLEQAMERLSREQESLRQQIRTGGGSGETGLDALPPPQPPGPPPAAGGQP